jgi:hypothetical protein
LRAALRPANLHPMPRLSLTPLLAVLALAAPEAKAQTPVSWPSEYTAEIVTTGKDIPGAIVTKYAMDGDKVRSEMNMEGQNMISIIRPDKKVIYMIMPAQKMYMETPLQDTPKSPGIPDFKEQAEKFKKGEGLETVGKETINGVACTKYKSGTGETVSFIWISESTGHPVRVAAANGSYQADWKNLKVGKPDASLFEPPAGYQKMGFPGMPDAGN